MKLFDKATKSKANGKWRLLLVDGHNSHYTVGFLKYACMHMIHVLCYPSHMTHIYQGLDVVIFSVLKWHLSDECDKWVCQHAGEINKTNFLELYRNVHLAALTSENVQAAFWKTGVWPFNPAVVTDETLAPSKPTSQQSNLSITLPTPLRVIADLFQKLSLEDDLETVDEASEGSDSASEPLSPSTAAIE